MSDKTAIEWTDATWNPVRGCSRVSPGCGGANHQGGCYAEKIAARFSGPGQPFHGFAERTAHGGRWTGKMALVDSQLDQPLRWKKPRRIFVNSMSDLFHVDLPDEAIDKVFAVMALCPQHTFQVLTKRADRMRAWFEEKWQPAPAHRLQLGDDTIDVPAETRGEDRHDQVHTAAGKIAEARGMVDPKNDAHWTPEGNAKALAFPWPLPNVWLGVSVEDQQRADERIPHLLATPAARRFLSCEPLLGPVSLRWAKWDDWHDGTGKRRPIVDQHDGLRMLDWIIAGGESGPKARPMHPDWARALRDQCQAASVPFFFKQWGAWAPDHYYCDPEAEMPEEPCDCRSGQECHVTPAGHLHDDDRDGQPPERTWTMKRVGKAAAGATLDGREWREFPA